MLLWSLLILLIFILYILLGKIFLSTIDIDQTISNWGNEGNGGKYWFSVVAWPVLFVIYMFHYIKAKYE